MRDTSTMARKHQNGSMTVEACMVVPLFLCIIISILFLVRLVYVREIVRHALQETAGEMASTAYIYQAAGLKGIHDAARERMETGTAPLKNGIRSILDMLRDLGAEDALPPEEMDAAAGLLPGAVYRDVKTEIFSPLAKRLMEKYITEGSGGTADDRLKALRVVHGLAGLDMSTSEFFEEDSEEIELIVHYEVDLPLPVNLFPPFRITQRAVAKAWLLGDEPGYAGADDSFADKIWSLPKLKRGTELRRIFGANLPYNFPVIARFEAGRAVMIKSMDLTSKSYQSPGGVSEVLDGYMNELSGYQGQCKPWGSSGIAIKENEIVSREILLIIPENEILPEVGNILANYTAIARNRGILLTVKRYGFKQEEKQGNDPVGR